jgi:sialidase-1
MKIVYVVVLLLAALIQSVKSEPNRVDLPVPAEDSLAQQSDGKFKKIRKVKDVIVYKDTLFHSAFPSIIRRPDGELLIAFRRAPERRLLGEAKTVHVDPNSYLMLTRSRDGENWSKPELLYAHPFGGSQDPCMLQLKDGTILCNSYAWMLVRPDGIPKLKKTASVINDGFVFMGGYQLRSTDGGKSWDGPYYPPVLKQQVGYNAYGERLNAHSRGAMVEAQDGRIYWSVAVRDSEEVRKASNYLLTSKDKGLTWDYSGEVAVHDSITFNETSLYQTPKGDLVAFMRTANYDAMGCIARSTDGGKTFKWQDLGFKGHPLHAIRLPDNRVLLTYGYRFYPRGLRARILNAECTDFATSEEIVLRTDGGTTDLGYAWSVMMDDNRVFIAYYYNIADGTRHIAGTILALE